MLMWKQKGSLQCLLPSLSIHGSAIGSVPPHTPCVLRKNSKMLELLLRGVGIAPMFSIMIALWSSSIFSLFRNSSDSHFSPSPFPKTFAVSLLFRQLSRRPRHFSCWRLPLSQAAEPGWKIMAFLWKAPLGGFPIAIFDFPRVMSRPFFLAFWKEDENMEDPHSTPWYPHSLAKLVYIGG